MSKVNFIETIHKIKKGIQIQSKVISGLYDREILTRISKVSFGLLGIFIEPIGTTVVFLLLLGFRRGFRPIFTLDLIIFLASGIILYTLVNSIGRRAIHTMQANQALFIYKRIKPIDTLIARTIVEINCYGIIYLVITVGYFAIQKTWKLDNLPLLFFCYIIMAIAGFGFGLIFMIMGHRFPLSKQIIPIVLRPLFFLSAIFYPVKIVPERFKPFITWNPIVHSVELSRKAFSDNYILDPSISIAYLLKFTLLVLTIGIIIYFKNERILLTK